MKKKINKMMILIATVTILLTMVLITVVYYDLFRRQVLEDLKSYGLLLSNCSSVEEIEQSGVPVESDLRLTIIGSDGRVLYDNEADSVAMGNHSSRPEIREAMQDGEGEAVRNSETLSRSTFYYAIRLADGSILRLSKDARSIYSIFSQALPMMAGIFIVLLILCMVAAKVLTAKLIAPIEKLAENIGECTEMQTYEELTPFMVMIRKQHEDIMKNARMRQEFSANVSHELKTPLTSISGYAELIETGMASEQDTVRFAHGIHNSANRLLTLINDIIRLSELDGTEGEADTELLDLHEMAQNCVEMLSMSAEKHDVTIALSGTECYVTANRQMMEELLYNLCDNAIRYNNPGGSVDVQTYAREDHTYLIVKDTGIGIFKEHQERIFERFYRVDKSRSKSTGGTGLGLAITKQLVDKMDGSIELKSKAGVGTTVIVKIPFKIGTQDKNSNLSDKPVSLDDYSVEGMRALVVEDNELNMEISRCILEDSGMEVTCAVDGQEAVEIFEKSAPDYFGVIYMDIMMPRMNGLDAARTIREMKRRDAKRVPIIAMSANAFAEDIINSRLAGMNVHLAKPLDAEKMIVALKQCMADNSDVKLHEDL